MNINRVKSTYQSPYIVMIIDALDAFYYADIIEGEENQIFAQVDSYELAVTLADALFVIKNYKWESLAKMNDVDGGYDVRVYDANLSCVYAAHERFARHWIKGA